MFKLEKLDNNLASALATALQGKRRVFLCRRTVRVKVKGKVIPASFLKIEGRGRSLEQKNGERDTVSRIGR